MITDPTLQPLEPALVWRHFATLCATPRASKQEERLRQVLLDWATGRKLHTRVDGAGNLILSKPASPGCAQAPGVILQGHLDMVCQKNAGTAHDFSRDPIRAELRDGWLVAPDTTLGADNGIGVALALAALEDDSLIHGPLEVLLTVDEEAGMGGVRGLQPGSLAGRYLLNLDTEEWGQFYLGCAGGVDVLASLPAQLEAVPAAQAGWRLEVTGLSGGHSGVDIHLGRANAIRVLLEVLGELAADQPLGLGALAGGTARNAIPREAEALFCLPQTATTNLEEYLRQAQARLLARHGETDPQLRLSLTPAPLLQALAPAASRALLATLAAAPCGVDRMSDHFAGVVESSDNLGVIRMEDGVCRADFLVRSLTETGRDALAGRIAALIEAAGGTALIQGAYPGWTPRPDSALLARCRQVYAREFGGEAGLQVIHAGLECGLLGASHPDLEMISFGPDIRGAHAPGERVQVASVGHCWQLLKALLADLALSPLSQAQDQGAHP